MDDVFAGQARADEPWAEPLEVAREVARALHERRDSLARSANPEPTFEFDSEGHVTGVRNEAQTESHSLIEALMVLANEQVAGYLEDRRLPTLYRVHERPEPRSVEFLADQLASLDIPTPALPKQHDPPAGGRRGRGDVADRGPGRARTGGPSAHWCCGRSSRPTTRHATSATPASASAALLPLHLADPPLPGRGGPPRAAPGARASTTRPRRRSSCAELGVHTSALEREAMKIERTADDVVLAFLLERRLAEAGPDEPPAFEGEVVGLIEKGAFIRFGEEGFEGFLRRSPDARLVDAERAGHRAGVAGERAARCGSAIRSRWAWRGWMRLAAAWI